MWEERKRRLTPLGLLCFGKGIEITLIKADDIGYAWEQSRVNNLKGGNDGAKAKKALRHLLLAVLKAIAEAILTVIITKMIG